MSPFASACSWTLCCTHGSVYILPISLVGFMGIYTPIVLSTLCQIEVLGLLSSCHICTRSLHSYCCPCCCLFSKSATTTIIYFYTCPHRGIFSDSTATIVSQYGLSGYSYSTEALSGQVQSYNIPLGQLDPL